MIIKYRMYTPKDFLKKEVNESIVFSMLNKIKNYKYFRRGDPMIKEPDYIVDSEGLEVTFASSDKARPSFLNDFCDGEYTSGDIQSDHFAYIENALERKAQKAYSTARTSLAILCMLEIFNWSSDENNTVNIQKNSLFSQIRRQYIDTGIFKNVYLLTPTLTKEWCIFDIGEGRQYKLTAWDEWDFPYFEYVDMIPDDNL